MKASKNKLIKGAIISRNKIYRYQLWRVWDDTKPKLLFIMLNPSTADSKYNDPTIIRCMNYAKDWGYGGIFVGNLFAFRHKDPKRLLKATDPIGRKNNKHLSKMRKKSKKIVCAWGHSGIVKKLSNKSMEHLLNIKPVLYCLELSKDGTPKHPLYLKKTLKPQHYLPQ